MQYISWETENKAELLSNGSKYYVSQAIKGNSQFIHHGYSAALELGAKPYGGGGGAYPRRCRRYCGCCGGSFEEAKKKTRRGFSSGKEKGCVFAFAAVVAIQIVVGFS